MGDITIGTCSCCSGRVTVPDNWLSTVPPVPTCKQCGAHPQQPHGAVVPMRSPEKEKMPKFREGVSWIGSAWV